MHRKKYEDFTTEEFALDDHFIDWCLHQNDMVNAFWKEWIKDHPRQKGSIEEARKIVISLHQADDTYARTTLKKDIWSHLSNRIRKEMSEDRTSTQPVSMRKVMAVAASFLLVFTIYQVYQEHSTTVEWTLHSNRSNRLESTTLSDGTQVILHPNSSIQYSTLFGDQKREIILKGEAFFDVSNDATSPFFVFANSTVTKVLGTSFLVKAFEGLPSVEVEVKSGTVEVFAHMAKDQEKPTSVIFKKGEVEIPKPSFKVRLTPNEKISYDINQKKMIKSIVEAPKLLKRNSSSLKVDFKDDPVTEVFETLEEAYGITLMYDYKEYEHCSISTILDDSPLFTKLDMICAALNLHYEEKGAIIYIGGSGCTQ